MGVPDDRIRPSQFRIRQVPPGPYEAIGFRFRDATVPSDRTVAVVVFDLDRLDDVLSAAVDGAGVEIDEVAFTFRTATRRDLQRKAIADAVVTARKNATAAAAPEDVTVGSVRSMVTDHVSRPRRLRAGRAVAMDTAESGSLESGPIEVSVGVEVEYRLEEP